MCLTCDLAMPVLEAPRSARSTVAVILQVKVQLMSDLEFLHQRQILQACSWTMQFRLTRQMSRTLLQPDTYSPWLHRPDPRHATTRICCAIERSANCSSYRESRMEYLATAALTQIWRGAYNTRGIATAILRQSPNNQCCRNHGVMSHVPGSSTVVPIASAVLIITQCYTIRL